MLRQALRAVACMAAHEEEGCVDMSSPAAASAGYSGTPLPKKLGIKDTSTVTIVGGPAPALPVSPTAGAAPWDVVLAFVTMAADLRASIAGWSSLITPDGGLWICWPKKTARKLVPAFAKSDMTEDVVREVVLPIGLVDNKVCAVDAVWSGLRVVWRVEVRASRRAAL